MSHSGYRASNMGSGYGNDLQDTLFTTNHTQSDLIPSSSKHSHEINSSVDYNNVSK